MNLFYVLSALLAASTAFSATTTESSSLDLDQRQRFDNHQLIRIPNTLLTQKTILRLNLDRWNKSVRFLDVRVSPTQKRQLERVLGKTMKMEVINPNIQTLIDAETAMLKKQKNTEADNWFTAYHQFDDVKKWLENLAKQYSSLAKYTDSIGETEEKRKIPMIRITGDKNSGAKKQVYLQGMQHAREWISFATMQFVANELLTKYGKDTRITTLMDKVEFIIVPVCNPDGYAYTWNGNRLWRKNRKTVTGRKYGVDMNRNWPDHWNNGGSSSDPNSDIYMGPSAGSEPEVQALMKLFKSLPNVIAAVDFHSYSELILRPYGWTEDNSPDEAAFAELGEKMKAAISSVAGTDYTNQRVVDLYVASGGSNDWWSGLGSNGRKQKVYGMAVELSPKNAWGGQGFILPPDRIIPVGNEVFPAILSMTEYALDNPLGGGELKKE